MRTTVVIPAYHAWSTLPAVLDALAPQIGTDREAIVVVSAADARVGQLAQRWPWLRVIPIRDRAFPGRARNIGASQARGTLLAFLDADAVPSPGWLSKLEQALSTELEAVGGAVVNGTPHSHVGTAEYLLEFSEVLPRRRRALRHAPSCNLLIRSAQFRQLGGFPEDLRAGEDTLLTFPLAARRRLGFAPDAVVQHMNRTNLPAFLANQRLLGAAFVVICRTVPFPHRWVCRGPALALAGPLRLVALTRCLLDNPSQFPSAIRSLPLLLLGLMAWTRGALAGRRELERQHVADVDPVSRAV